MPAKWCYFCIISRAALVSCLRPICVAQPSATRCVSLCVPLSLLDELQHHHMWLVILFTQGPRSLQSLWLDAKTNFLFIPKVMDEKDYWIMTFHFRKGIQYFLCMTTIAQEVGTIPWYDTLELDSPFDVCHGSNSCFISGYDSLIIFLMEGCLSVVTTFTSIPSSRSLSSPFFFKPNGSIATECLAWVT